MGIARRLEDDPYYLPDPEEYLVETQEPPPTRTVCCHRLNEWDDWQMFWSFKYSSIVPSSPEVVVIGLRQERIDYKDLRPIDP